MVSFSFFFILFLFIYLKSQFNAMFFYLHIIYDNIIYIYIYIYVSWLIMVKSDLKAPLSIATTLRCGGGHYFFPWIAPLTFDPYLIMLSVKQRAIKYHFWSLRYDSAWDWMLVPGPLANTLTIILPCVSDWKYLTLCRWVLLWVEYIYIFFLIKKIRWIQINLC